jgi:hypothetical protein
MSLSIGLLNINGTTINSFEMGSQFRSIFYFALSMGSIPLLYLAVEQITKFKLQYQGLKTIGIILASGILLWFIRIIQLNRLLNMTSGITNELGLNSSLRFEILLFSQYLFIGFLIGAIISGIIFRYEKTSNSG